MIFFVSSSHLVRLDFAISRWLCSLFSAIISFKLLYIFFCIKSTIKIAVVVEDYQGQKFPTVILQYKYDVELRKYQRGDSKAQRRIQAVL